MSRSALPVLATLSLVASMAGTAHAGKPKVIDHVTAEQVAQLLGSTSTGIEVSVDDVGDPIIQAKAGDLAYSVMFYNCQPDIGCDSVQYRAWWPTRGKADPAAINAYVRDYRVGRAYLDSDLDASYELLVNLHGGVTLEHIRAEHEAFLKGAQQFKSIGIKMMED